MTKMIKNLEPIKKPKRIHPKMCANCSKQQRAKCHNDPNLEAECLMDDYKHHELDWILAEALNFKV